jgi:hypothetical protein
MYMHCHNGSRGLGVQTGEEHREVDLGKGVLGRYLAGFFIVYTDIGWLSELGSERRS